MAKILLVDDDVDLVEMYTAVLANRGHRVLAAYSAEEARGILDREKPDAAVLDVMMESQTAGFQLALDMSERFPGLPIIVVSGIHTELGTPFRVTPDADWLPVVKFIDKPVAPLGLAAEVEALLKGRD